MYQLIRQLKYPFVFVLLLKFLYFLAFYYLFDCLHTLFPCLCIDLAVPALLHQHLSNIQHNRQPILNMTFILGFQQQASCIFYHLLQYTLPFIIKASLQPIIRIKQSIIKQYVVVTIMQISKNRTIVSSCYVGLQSCQDLGSQFEGTYCGCVQGMLLGGVQRQGWWWGQNGRQGELMSFQVGFVKNEKKRRGGGQLSLGQCWQQWILYLRAWNTPQYITSTTTHVNISRFLTDNQHNLTIHTHANNTPTNPIHHDNFPISLLHPYADSINVDNHLIANKINVLYLFCWSFQLYHMLLVYTVQFITGQNLSVFVHYTGISGKCVLGWSKWDFFGQGLLRNEGFMGYYVILKIQTVLRLFLQHQHQQTIFFNLNTEVYDIIHILYCLYIHNLIQTYIVFPSSLILLNPYSNPTAKNPHNKKLPLLTASSPTFPDRHPNFHPHDTLFFHFHILPIIQNLITFQYIHLQACINDTLIMMGN